MQPTSLTETPVPSQSALTEPITTRGKSKIWLWVLAGVLLLTIGIAGGIFLGKQIYSQPTPVPSAFPTPLPTEASVDEDSPTTNWQMYEDFIFNFALQYPKQWQVSPESQVSPTGDWLSATLLQIYSPKDRITEGDEIEGGVFSVSVTRASQEPLIQRIQSYTDSFDGIQSTYKSDYLTGTLITARKLGPLEGKLFKKTLIIQHKELIYYVDVMWNQSEVEIGKKFDLMFSTFKFLDDRS